MHVAFKLALNEDIAGVGIVVDGSIVDAGEAVALFDLPCVAVVGPHCCICETSFS